MGVPVVIGGDNLLCQVGIGLTDLPNIGITVIMENMEKGLLGAAPDKADENTQKFRVSTKKASLGVQSVIWNAIFRWFMEFLTYQ